MPPSSYDFSFNKALQLLREHLPARIQSLIDFSTLTRVDRTNTRFGHKRRRRGTAYEALMKGGHQLLVRTEQLSRPNVALPARLLSHNVGDFGQYLKERKRIPLLVNVLHYKGEAPSGSHHIVLHACYNDPAAGDRPVVYTKHIDLSKISDEEMLGHGHCAPMELLLKHGEDGNFELEIDAYRGVFQALIETVGDDHITVMLDYAVALREEVGSKIYHFLEKVLDNKKDVFMTYGERLQQQGRQEEREQIAERMLAKGYDADEVKTLTGVSAEAISQIKSAGDVKES